MILPIRGGRITAGFDDMRPLEGPKTHKHGALDVAGGDGVAVAPASGLARAMVFLRGESPWLGADKPEVLEVPVRHYWYDLYGGVIEVQTLDGTYLVMTHFWASRLEERFGRFRYVESSAKVRSPSIALMCDPVRVVEGEELCRVGNAGYSTGPHVHFEGHHSHRVEPYADRIDLSRVLR